MVNFGEKAKIKKKTKWYKAQKVQKYALNSQLQALKISS